MKLLLLSLGVVLSLSMGSLRGRNNPPPIEQKPPEEVSQPSTPTIEAPEEVSQPSTPTIEAPAGTVLVSAKIAGKTSDAARIAKIQSLTPIVQKILNSPEFESQMLKAWFNGKPGFQDSKDSPAQVIQKLKGSNWVQVYEFGTNSRKVLGWTYPSTATVWFNSLNFDGRDDCGLVGTRFHEETHKRGYGHKNAGRSLSVPYYTGTTAAQICNQLKSKGDL